MTNSNNILLCRIIIFFILAFSFFILSLLLPVTITEIEPTSDLANYYKAWCDLYMYRLEDIIFSYEPGYVLLSKILSYFFTFSDFTWFIRFIFFYSFLMLAFSLYKDILAVIILSLIFFFFLPYEQLGNTAIRQGLATSVLFFYLSIIDVDRIVLKDILFLSVLIPIFHYSGFFVLIALVLFFYIKGIYPFLIWCIANVLYIAGISGTIGTFIYDFIALYGIQSSSVEITDAAYGPAFVYVLGFKPIFLFVSSFSVITALILSFSGLLTIGAKALLCIPLFRFYFMLNSLCVFTSDILFHDRFFIWSWVFAPLLIIYVIKFFKYRIIFS